jgi:crotonobetainyl-CoA:carnitine CoA-transferase CaiB-like acyl-CoA transferase
VLPTADGWMAVMCAKEKFYRSLVRIMGAPELGDDPRFNSFEARMDNREALGAALKKLSRARTTAEWLEDLRGEVPCAPVNTVGQALQDSQVAEDRMVLEMEHPDLGTVRQLASPIKISGTTPEHRLGPGLGQHTDEVLRDYAGATDREIAAWRSKAVL